MHQHQKNEHLVIATSIVLSYCGAINVAAFSLILLEMFFTWFLC